MRVELVRCSISGLGKNLKLPFIAMAQTRLPKVKLQLLALAEGEAIGNSLGSRYTKWWNTGRRQERRGIVRLR
jgi:hypothetical protein